MRRSLCALVVISMALRLGLAACLGLGNDEAYHALFARYLDWSYFDHPPMVALIERLGLTLSGGAMTVVTLRVGFIALFAGSTLLMARVTNRFYGPRAGFLAALILNVSAYFGGAAGTFALPDGPLLFFWLLTLDQLAVATAGADRKRLGPWIGVGLAWGGALLSKYHAVFLPMGVLLYLVSERSARSWLRHPGPYLATILGLVVASPVLGWNAEHDWVSFAFQGGRALGSWRFRPEALAEAIGGQVLYLLPWIWGFVMMSLIRSVRALRRGEAPKADRFLLCQAVMPLVVFLLVACHRKVLPHWSLIGLVPIFPMLGRDWDLRWPADSPRMRRRFAFVVTTPIVVAVLLTVQARTGFLQTWEQAASVPVAIEADPTIEQFGWDQVARELERRGLTRLPNTFLFTDRWYYSAQLAFALRESTPVLCYNTRHAQNFAYWSEPEDWVGCDGIFVAINNIAGERDYYAQWFNGIEPIGTIPISRGGVTVRLVHLFRCRNQRLAFPFGNTAHLPQLAHSKPTGSSG